MVEDSEEPSAPFLSLSPRPSWVIRAPWPLLAAMLAVLLTLPSLRAGWMADDYFHRAVMTGSTHYGEMLPPWWNMFRFFDGNPERMRRAMDLGFLPWWTYPHAKAAFFRPLTALTHRADYWLWPSSPIWMHAQSILWYAVAVAAIACVYRRLLPAAGLAATAAVFYAVNDAHGMVVGFLANRNTLIALTFAAFTLIAHDRWRREHRPAFAVPAAGALLLSLFAKEAGLAICGYLAAYALWIDRTSWRGRLFSLAPYVLVVVAWRAIWTTVGAGVEQVGGYVDPLVEPARYASAVLRHLPLMLLGQWALPPAETSSIVLKPMLGEGFAVWHGRVAISFCVLLALALWPILRQSRLARFWATGMMLSALPTCAAFPMDRLLMFVGIGAYALLSQFFAAAFRRGEGRPARRAGRIAFFALGGFLFLIHVVLSPLLMPLRAAWPAGSRVLDEQLHVRTPMDESLAQQDLVLVNPPSIIHAAYAPLLREANGQSVPRHLRTLAPGMGRLTLHRSDECTLVIRPDKGFVAGPLDSLVRDERNPMAVGQAVHLTGLTVTVSALTPDRRPAEAMFRFEKPLEAPSLRWLHWEKGEFVPFVPPPMGATTVLNPGPPRLW
ncbi:MAG: hypothetical protein JXB13_16935 [Phycisphaerae bacterium]|nr:hypothetical protein [Phycisphaerae bacterium]